MISHEHTKHEPAGHHGHAHADPGPGESPLKDPVCGMTVTEQSPHRHDYKERTYFFCSEKCRAKFSVDPVKYVEPAAEAPAVTEAGTVYVCPMHPEIRRDKPGTCPKCGMALEPELPSLDEEENPEFVDFRRRFWWTLPLTITVTLLAMFGHQLGWFAMATQTWIELVLSVPVVLWAGFPFFERWAQSIANKSPNMWTLIGTGTGAAFLCNPSTDG